MADLFWDRLEPHTRDPELEEALQAWVTDPLWLWARQWQLGEFYGEDAASPIHIRVTTQHHPLSGFRGDDVPGSPAEPFPEGRPLESRVEAEAIGGRGRVAVAADVGLQLLRRLDEVGLGHLRVPLRAAFKLALPPGSLAGLPSHDQRRLRLMARRSLDGLRALDAGRDAVLAVAGPEERPDMEPAVDAWRKEQLGRFDLPGDSGETWVEDRLEHRFSITADTAGAEITFGAQEYPGGRLDWHAFDVAGRTPRVTPLPPPAAEPLHLLPVPLTYSGMPASSYWELEEGSVYFGGVEAGPADIGRLAVAEFALVYSNDYFLFPLRFPAGCIARITDMEVRNTFGESFPIRSTAQWDEEAPGTGRAWAFFELSGDTSPANGQAPWLLLVPALPTPQNGPPLESVTFVRDGEANLVWAVEERVETATGGSVRSRLMAGLTPEAAPEPVAPADGAWGYRLQSPVPPWWIPFVPERIDPESPQVKLRRGRLLAWEELEDPSVAGPKGRVLAPDRPLRLCEEEIPATGAEVTRRWQLARGADGRPHLWMARRKRPGRGERGSGLAYDTIDRS
jgi:hypothetical protein